jgi:uncharacterized protein (TIGR04255 family)
MTAPPHFDPVFPGHAIEQCTATVRFDQALPTKILSKLQAEHKTKLLEAGLKEGKSAVGFQFDLLTGKVVPLQDGPVSYVTSDNGTTITIVANQVSIQTARYIRWANFESAASKFLMPLVRGFCESVSINSVQLDYRDRFLWTGSWDDFDSASLLNSESELVAPKVAHAPQQWHCHSGWFEQMPEPSMRRLVNVNIDVVTAVQPDTTLQRPSVGIYTSVLDTSTAAPSETAPNWFDESGVLPHLRTQHLDLKELLRSLISPAMAQKIKL